MTWLCALSRYTHRGFAVEVTMAARQYVNEAEFLHIEREITSGHSGPVKSNVRGHSWFSTLVRYEYAALLTLGKTCR